ncbi:MAG: GntR family transcriptional regulator [Acidimicrobiales bacterium]|nr:GntR family transcriptional regulator [Acidimicrobiales bacterium]
MDDRATSARVARTEGVARLVADLGSWSAGPGSLYRQLARAIAAAVERGDLERGRRLPSERALAVAVAVSRGVVVAAYDQLVADEVVDRRQGSGTFVAGSPDVGLPPRREGSALVARYVGPAAPVPQPVAHRLIDLSISVLRDPTGLPDASVGATELVDLAEGAGGTAWGLPGLRRLVARQLTERGLPTEPEQVLLTTGAQQAIALAAACWVRPGDAVVIDDPTYPGAPAAFGAAGAVLRPVPVDRDGVVMAALRAALAAHPTLAYLQSGPHSPTGTLLSAYRRREVAKLVVEHRVPLVEDLALDGLRWGAPSDRRRGELPLVASHAPDHAVVVVGSFSKLFWAGLRVGFARAPDAVVGRLARVKATHDLGSSLVAQALALRLLERSDHAEFVADRNATLARRASLLVDLLAEHLPTWHVSRPTGGLSLWVALPAPTAHAFAAAALQRGVAVATAEGLSAAPGAHAGRLRLTFAVPDADLREAVHRLAAAWADVDR